MAIIKSLISALSTYSKIPMPNIKYKDGDGRFTLIFFPVVGLVIGFLCKMVYSIEWSDSLSYSASCILYMLAAVVVTGGIHIDGFMDSMDAIHSYGDKEKKLAILTDPHVGAFSIIKLLELCGIWYVSLSMTHYWFHTMIYCGFVVSRILSAMAIACFSLAKEGGMLHYTRTHSSPVCKYILLVELIALYVYVIYDSKLYGIAPIAVSILCFTFYYFKSKKDFGGTTGDTAGCFLVMTETAWMITVAISSLVRFQ